jgi:hypothetical protein
MQVKIISAHRSLVIARTVPCLHIIAGWLDVGQTRNNTAPSAYFRSGDDPTATSVYIWLKGAGKNERSVAPHSISEIGSEISVDKRHYCHHWSLARWPILIWPDALRKIEDSQYSDGFCQPRWAVTKAHVQLAFVWNPSRWLSRGRYPDWHGSAGVFFGVGDGGWFAGCGNGFGNADDRRFL